MWGASHQAYEANNQQILPQYPDRGNARSVKYGTPGDNQNLDESRRRIRSRRRLTLASTSDLTANKQIFFFSCQNCHTRERTLERNQIMGKFAWLSRSRLKFTRSSKEQRGRCFLTQARTQLSISELESQVIREWTRSSVWLEVQKLQTALSFCLRWWRRALIGRILCNILKLKEICSEVRPFKLANSQLLSQMTFGKLTSHFTSFHTRTFPSAFIVTLFSISTLYHCLVDIVEMFSNPSVTTSLIAEKNQLKNKDFFQVPPCTFPPGHATCKGLCGKH